MNPALLLSDDLIFTSRVTATARAGGGEVRAVRSADLLIMMARLNPPACVILDLQNGTLDLTTLLDELRELPAPPRVVAYGSHVDAESLRAARAAGCDVVLPRSKFAAELEAELPKWLSGKE